MIELSPPLARDTQTTMPATNITQDSTPTPNEFALCLRALLRPSSALSHCEFAAYMRALIPSPVPAGTTQHGSRLGESVLHASRTIHRFLPDNIHHIATVTWGYLLLPSPRIMEYSDDILIVFSPQHFLYHPPAPFPDNSITIAAAVIVWAVLFMWQFRAQPAGPPAAFRSGRQCCEYSQMSLNLSISQLSSSQMRTTRVSLLRVFFLLEVLLVGCEGFHRPWDHSIQEILPSLRTLTNEAKRTLDLPRRRSRQGTSPWLSM